jgi:hypothetical protein
MLELLKRITRHWSTKREHLAAAWSHYQELELLLTTEDQKQRFKLLYFELRAALNWPPR